MQLLALLLTQLLKQLLIQAPGLLLMQLTGQHLADLLHCMVNVTHRHASTNGLVSNPLLTSQCLGHVPMLDTFCWLSFAGPGAGPYNVHEQDEQDKHRGGSCGILACHKAGGGGGGSAKNINMMPRHPTGVRARVCMEAGGGCATSTCNDRC